MMDWFMEGLKVTLIGMSITILMLIALMCCVIIQSKLVGGGTNNRKTGKRGNGSDGGKDANSVEKGKVALSESNPVFGANPVSDTGSANVVQRQTNVFVSEGKGRRNDEGTLIAIITAAIAMATSDRGTPFKVVSFRKTGRTAPAWNIMGRQEYLAGKF